MHQRSAELNEIAGLVDNLVEQGRSIEKKLEKSGDSATSQDVARYIEAISALRDICLEDSQNKGGICIIEHDISFLM